MLVKTGMCTCFSIPQRGYRLRFYPSNLSEQLWVNWSLRDNELRLLRDYLRVGDFVIDIGANIGDTALTAWTKIGFEGRIWAIEPHPRTFSFLKGNIAFNDAQNIVPINAAVAAGPGRLSFSNDRRDDMNRVGEATADTPAIHVEARSLDELVPSCGPIELLKIDVEGYELQVLNGGLSTLARTNCVFFEASDNHFRQYGDTLAALLRLLAAQGFKLLRPISGNRVVPIDDSFSPRGVENLIAVRDVLNFLKRSGWEIEGR